MWASAFSYFKNDILIIVVIKQLSLSGSVSVAKINQHIENTFCIYTFEGMAKWILGKKSFEPYSTNVADRDNFGIIRVYNSQVFALITSKTEYASFFMQTWQKHY